MELFVWIDETPQLLHAKRLPRAHAASSHASKPVNAMAVASDLLSGVENSAKPKKPRRAQKTDQEEAGLQAALLASRSLIKDDASAKRKKRLKADPDATNILPTLEAKRLISQKLDALLETSHDQSMYRLQLEDLYMEQPPFLSQSIASCRRLWRESQGLDLYASAAYCLADFQTDVHLLQPKLALGPTSSASLVAMRDGTTALSCPTATNEPAILAHAAPRDESLVHAQRSSIRDYYGHLLKAKEAELNAQIEALMATHQSWMDAMIAERDDQLAGLL